LIRYLTNDPQTYTRLHDFLISHMRMSHVYQPVMLKTLIEGKGKASLRDISAAFLAHDQAQLEYYEEITKRMPGRVLQNHGLVERSDTLNIKLRRVGSGRRRTFTNPGEIVLDKWMAQHARVAWAAVEAPWLVEKRLLLTVPLPLNLQGNAHPFVSTLKGIRSAARQSAQRLPVVTDSGGPRRRSS
jgi:GIY-YIG catalytic domain